MVISLVGIAALLAAGSLIGGNPQSGDPGNGVLSPASMSCLPVAAREGGPDEGDENRDEELGGSNDRGDDADGVEEGGSDDSDDGPIPPAPVSMMA